MQNNKNILELTSKNFAELFGTTEEEILEYCRDQIASFDFHYRKVKGEERDRVTLEVIKHIDSENVDIAGQQRQPDWEKGWNENLQEFIHSGYDIDKLTPKYFKKNVFARLKRDYVIPVNEDFALNVTRIFRSWLFQKYLQGVDSIYEFGCGTAHHLAFLATLFPDKKLYGFDWVKSSQEIIRLLAQHYRWSIHGAHFDFFHPDKNIQFEPNSAVLTFAALEQIGKNHEQFLFFLLEKSPKICINVEGLCELYDQNYLLDYLALKYHKHRNYLDGFLTRLRELEKEKKITIIKVHHQQFGNLFNDSHSYVIWKPKIKQRESLC